MVRPSSRSLWRFVRLAARGTSAFAGAVLLPAVLGAQSAESPVTLEFATNREEGTNAPSANPVFPLLETEEVVARVTMPPQPGVQILTLSLLFATGVPYLTAKRAFHSVGPGADVVPDPDTGLSLPVEEAPVIAGRTTVLISIPVRGTLLERFGMSGEYEARVAISGPRALDARGRFTLTPPR